jgi:hypothetical protein
MVGGRAGQLQLALSVAVASTMVQLDRALFGGNSEQISNSDTLTVEVSNLESSADGVLKQFHWKGGLWRAWA